MKRAYNYHVLPGVPAEKRGNAFDVYTLKESKMNKKLSPTMLKIVNILRDGQYHDGDALGEACQMTRSAVWKVMKKLKQYGVPLHSIKGRGYCLTEPFSLLDRNKIKSHLKQLTFGSHDELTSKLQIEVFETITSTNTYLKTKQPETLTICFAEQQTQGKARLNREWHSPFGQNLYLSLLYCFEKDVSELAGLSLISSLAVLKTLHSMGIDKQFFVKWPNDVYHDNKKLAGILIEIQAETHGISQAIIGVGLNVNMVQECQQISQPWVSLRKILGHSLDRNLLGARLIHHLFLNLEQFKTEGFVSFMPEWTRVDCLSHKMVTIKNVNEQIQGYVTGINDQGHLLLKLQNNEVRVFSAGDTSIVK